MAEALAVIGTIGAVCNIVDVISKTITLIGDVQSRWKTADLALLSLASQLTALRAALREIQMWLESNAQIMHHQLTMDLDVSLSCCRLLVIELEAFFSRLNTTSNDALGASGKMKVVVGSQGASDIQKFIEHQTSSLTLLLTACNCTTLSEQRQLLEKPKSRKSIERVKADSASLLVHRDSASFISRWTDNMSKLSHVFNFDTVLLSSRVYERIFRNSLKQSVRQQLPETFSAPSHNVLLLGDDDLAKMTIERSVLSQFPFERRSEALQLSKCSPTLQKACWKLTLEAVREEFDEVNFCRLDIEELLPIRVSSSGLDPYFLHTLTSFWEQASFRQRLADLEPIEELRGAWNYISKRMKQPRMTYLHADTSWRIFSDRSSSTSFIANDRSMALLHIWGSNLSFPPLFCDRSNPLAVFCVFDLSYDTWDMDATLKHLAFIEGKLSRSKVSLIVFLTNSDSLKYRIAPGPTVEAVVQKLQDATTLPFSYYIVSLDDQPTLDSFVATKIRELALRS